ncbi:MAG: Ldh family oxidoreductase [Chloroflexota bacterium]
MMRGTEKQIAGQALQRIARAILAAAGTPHDLAQVVAESLVDANLAGYDSHGAMRLPTYVRLIQTGQVKPAERAEVSGRHQATATVDGRWGWGQPAARLAMETAIALATKFGIGAVTIQRCNHIGRVGEYVEAMTRAGMMGIALCNAGAVVAPYGGRERRLGTNPFAWAAPTADPEHPLLLDFATSVLAGGKLEVAHARGQTIKPGVLLDAEGQPSIVPDDFFRGGALLPFGAYKGYAMGVMVELLAGALSGAAPSCLPEYNSGNGTLMVAFNIATFQPLAQFMDQATRFSAVVGSSQPATGSAGVLLPGDPATEARRQRGLTGIPLPAATWQALHDLAARLGLRIEEETDDIHAV